MQRRKFIIQTSTVSAGVLLAPSCTFTSTIVNNIGVQLYSFREELAKDPIETLKKIAELGFKKIETATSAKGHYYGMKPSEMQTICVDLGLSLVSGHVSLDQHWEQTIEEAVAAKQEYLICSTLPFNGQTVDNYKKVADAFNKAGEDCKKAGLKFGYHNHEYEFETHKGEVLYDVLLKNTDANLVHMELDLGWVVVAGKKPLDYFKTYPGRFPLWHLKDMNMTKKESTEFGKGGLNIPAILKNQKASGVKHIFVEQEEYASSAVESMRHNLSYLEEVTT